MSKQLRVGILSGAFDPVHAGHISFALQAQRTAQLDEICFVPERKQSRHIGLEHFAHRVAMLRRALRPYEQFALAEFVERELSVMKTLPQLHRIYRGAQLVLLMGVEVFETLPTWPHAAKILRECEFVVQVRNHAEVTHVLHVMQQYAVPMRSVTMIESPWPSLQTESIREAVQHESAVVPGMLTSVRNYARQEWLYARIQ